MPTDCIITLILINATASCSLNYTSFFLSYVSRSTSSGSSINSPVTSIGVLGGSGGNGVGHTSSSMAYGAQFAAAGAQYCSPADNITLGPHYSSPHGWYQSTAADPRFASKYRSLIGPIVLFS